MPPKRTLSSSASPSKKRKSGPAQSGFKDGNLDFFFNKQIHKTSLGESSSSNTSMPLVNTQADDERVALKLAEEDGTELETIVKLEQEWKTSVLPRTKQPNIEVIDVDELPDVPPSGTFHRDTFQSDKKNPESHKKTPLIPNAPSSPINAQSYLDLSEDPLLLSVDKCPWTVDRPSDPKEAPYSFLAHSLCSLSGTRSRIIIINILTNTLRFIIKHSPSSLLPSLYLLSNSLAPPYIPVELGLGPTSISKAIQHVSGLSSAALRRLYTKTGDAGDVAFEAKTNIRTLIPHSALTIIGVYESLLKICNSKGGGAAKQRQSIAEKLLVSARGEETRYLVRTMTQHIRVGAVRTSILTALARALVLTRPKMNPAPLDNSPYFTFPSHLSKLNVNLPKGRKKNDEDLIRAEIVEKFANSEALIKRVYVQHPNYNDIIGALLSNGLEELSERVTLSIGIPLLPTLGSPTRSLDEVYDHLGNLPFAAEFKYDGQRAQIHAQKNNDGDLKVWIFSRHLENMTDKYPDITALINMIFDACGELKSFIIDTEIVAIDNADGSLRTFQELSGRARKDVRLEDIKIQVCVFAFDLMFLNDEILLGQPFQIRRQKLKEFLPPFTPEKNVIARFAHVEYCESTDGREAVEEFWQKAVDSRSEGLMIKLLDNGEITEDPDTTKGKPRKKPLPATYEPDKRTSAWLKLKKDYVLGVGDSLDLVPIGAWHGNGRKASWWSPILLAVWDESQEELVAVCKCMSGFTDEFYKALNERYSEGSESCSRTIAWGVNTGGYNPQVYFKPQEVWEIRGADITQSPISVAALGLVSQDRGLSLRFPRFIRVREDKTIRNASTSEFLAKMWKNQEHKGKDITGNDEGDLIDVSEEESEIEGEEGEDD